MENNNYLNQKIRGLYRKYEAVKEKGGKCEKCGYNKNITALDFHHREPDTKEFQLDIRKFSNTNLASLKQELDKCDLLCANCHRELHNPLFEMGKIDTVLIAKRQQLKLLEEKKIKKETIKCKNCSSEFAKVKGKIFCSKSCRYFRDERPTKEQILEEYSKLKSWTKVIEKFQLTKRIITNIRFDRNKFT